MAHSPIVEQPHSLLPSNKRKCYLELMYFLERHNNEDLSLFDVAEGLGKSQQYLRKVSIHFRGMQLSKFIQLSRLERARELLKDHSQARAAKLTGYSEKDLIRCCMSIYGLSPEQIQTDCFTALSLKEAVQFHETFGLKQLAAVPHRDYFVTPQNHNRTLIVANQTSDKALLFWHPEDSAPILLKIIPAFSRFHLSSTPSDKLSITTSQKSETFEMHNFNSIFVVAEQT